MLKDQVEGEKHNKWLWEVSFVVALLLAHVITSHCVLLGCRSVEATIVS